jgi:hypothetical protein
MGALAFPGEISARPSRDHARGAGPQEVSVRNVHGINFALIIFFSAHWVRSRSIRAKLRYDTIRPRSAPYPSASHPPPPPRRLQFESD